MRLRIGTAHIYKLRYCAYSARHVISVYICLGLETVKRQRNESEATDHKEPEAETK